jgi:hypothetical protein
MALVRMNWLSSRGSLKIHLAIVVNKRRIESPTTCDRWLNEPWKLAEATTCSWHDVRSTYCPNDIGQNDIESLDREGLGFCLKERQGAMQRRPLSNHLAKGWRSAIRFSRRLTTERRYGELSSATQKVWSCSVLSKEWIEFIRVK